ncbi:MAG: hypothetical protein GC154_18760 [bacterium]|nr:hypothetical protein [bacterium]
MGIGASWIMLLGVMVGLVFTGGARLLDLPSLISVFFTFLGLLLLSFSFRDLASAVSAIFQSRASSALELRRAAHFWKTALRAMLHAGVLMMLVGTCSMAQNISDPSAIAPSLGISLLTVLYALIFALFGPIPAYFLMYAKLQTLPLSPAPLTEKYARPNGISTVVGALFILMCVSFGVQQFLRNRDAVLNVGSLILYDSVLVGAFLWMLTFSSASRVTKARWMNAAMFCAMLISAVASGITLILGMSTMLASSDGRLQSILNFKTAISSISQSMLFGMLFTAILTLPWQDRAMRDDDSPSISSDLIGLAIPVLAFVVMITCLLAEFAKISVM